MIIPFSPPYIDQSVIDEVVSSLNSGWITSGPKVNELEKSLASYTGVSNILCVNSWTSGAILILKWFGIQEGDEVIVPAYTYCATALAVMHCGAIPVMVDITDNFTISVKEIANAITEKTKAIIPVDIAGWPCDYEEIMKLVNEPSIKQRFKPNNQNQRKLGRLLVLADSAHSFGALKNGKSASTFSDISIFSLHAVKNLTTAEGGAISLQLPLPFNNNDLYNYLKIMSLNGQTKDAFTKSKAGGWKYDILMCGYKFNMPDICASIGLAQIRKYEYILHERSRVFKKYTSLFKKYDWAQLPPSDNDNQKSSYHLYALRIINISENQRDEIINFVTLKGIAVNVHFIPLPMLTLFKDLAYDILKYPIAYDCFSREISLPIYPQLTDEQVEYIVKNIVQAYNSIKNFYD